MPTSTGSKTIESWLDQFDATYTLKSLQVALIDTTLSRNNQVRAQVIDQDNLQSIKIADKNGIVLPPVVVRRELNGAYKVLDGNHRHQAAIDNGRQEIMAYVVDCTSIVAEQIAFAANNGNGKRNTDSEQHAHVARLVNSGSLTQKEAAAKFNLSSSVVSRVCRAAKARARLRPKQIGNKLSDKALVDLAEIRSNEVFGLVADEFVRLSLGNVEAKNLIGLMDQGATEAVQMDQVLEFLSVVEATKNKKGRGSKKVHSPMMNLITSIGKIESITPVELGRDAGDQKDVIRDRLNRLIEHIESLRKAL